MHPEILHAIHNMMGGIFIIANQGYKDSDLIGIENHPRFADVILFNCAHNNFTKIPNFPNVITVICNNNLLFEIPCWDKVQYVYCDFNFLTALPNWQLVIKISCRNNLIEGPLLTNWTNLRSLDCADNYITEFCHWRYLYNIDFSSNKITSIPNWPRIAHITCYGNDLDIHIDRMTSLITILHNHNRVRGNTITDITRLEKCDDTGMNIHNIDSIAIRRFMSPIKKRQKDWSAERVEETINHSLTVREPSVRRHRFL